MKIGAIQCRPVVGDIAANTARHVEFIQLAIQQEAGLVFFPELSLTGYEPRLARSLATDKMDPRLDVFQELSDTHKIIIGVGLPISAGNEVQIGMVWFTRNEPRRNYAKQLLHADEFPLFVQGTEQLLLQAADDRLAPAICYESLQPRHAESAASMGANIYLASVAKPARAMANAVVHYPTIARKYGMHVVMANCLGPSDDMLTIGQSGAWNNRGELLAQMDSSSEGIMILDTGSDRTAIHVSDEA
jgi:predicted amidohydrolase